MSRSFFVKLCNNSRDVHFWFPYLVCNSYRKFYVILQMYELASNVQIGLKCTNWPQMYRSTNFYLSDVSIYLSALLKSVSVHLRPICTFEADSVSVHLRPILGPLSHLCRPVSLISQPIALPHPGNRV